MSINSAVLKKAIAKLVGRRVVADGTVKLRLRCVASPAGSASYADAVVVSATSLTLSIDGVADSTVGSSGVLAFATYTTLGSLVDAINLSANWEAEIVAGLRSDAVNGSELLARSTSTFRMFEEVSLYADSSDNGVSQLAFLIEPNRSFEFVRGDHDFKSRRVGLMSAKGLVNTGDSGAWDLTVYELRPDKASALRTLAAESTADNTASTGLATKNDTPYFHADYGNSLLVVVSDGSWSDTGAYLEVQGIVE